MLVLKGTKAEIAAAGGVSQQLELIEIILSKVNAWNRFDRLPNPQTQLKVKISEPIGKYELSKHNTLLVKSAVTITGIMDDGNPVDTPERERELLVLLIESEFMAEFKIPQGEMPDDVKNIGLPAFAKLNGPYLCMPYIRQMLHDIAGKMKLDLPPLPTLKIQSLEENAAEGGKDLLPKQIQPVEVPKKKKKKKE